MHASRHGAFTALLRRDSGSIKALLRLYCGLIKADVGALEQALLPVKTMFKALLRCFYCMGP